MRYPTILSAACLASWALVTAPAPVQSQTTTDKVEQKADQAWQTTKDVTNRGDDRHGRYVADGQDQDRPLRR